MNRLGRPIVRNKPTWWVTGRKKDGKMCLLGGFGSETEADDIMFSAFPNDTGRKFLLMTSERGRATQQLKYILFSETHDLDGSMQPISHIK
jgi:hypothetical protein